jgi:hypothetical protein
LTLTAVASTVTHTSALTTLASTVAHASALAALATSVAHTPTLAVLPSAISSFEAALKGRQVTANRCVLQRRKHANEVWIADLDRDIVVQGGVVQFRLHSSSASFLQRTEDRDLVVPGVLRGRKAVLVVEANEGRYVLRLSADDVGEWTDFSKRLDDSGIRRPRFVLVLKGFVQRPFFISGQRHTNGIVPDVIGKSPLRARTRGERGHT